MISKTHKSDLGLAVEYKDGLVVGFEPRFKSFDKDWDRYLSVVVDLLDQGKIDEVPGKSLYESHCGAGYEWLIDQYFQHGALDALERHFTPEGEVPFGPIEVGARQVLDRLMQMGEVPRVRRIWRAHTGLLKAQYWFYIAERRKGFRYESRILNVSEEEQRASHEEFIGRIPEKKAMLLSLMTDYRSLCATTGASAAELARIDSDIAAIEAEERPRPKGKTDTRPMTEDVFWDLIDNGLNDRPLGERLADLPDRLALFKPTAIRKFDVLLREMDARAYRTDVWALAYLMRGGCSDDAFDSFRGWLIMQGRQVFEATLADPDGFDVSLYHGEAAGMDALRDVAPIAYDMREGKAMKPLKAPLLKLSGPSIDEDQFATALPRIAAAVGAG
jgi:hypothetical protein